MPQSPTIGALILAGGEGRRLGGVRKGDIKFLGNRLVERMCAQLRMHAHPLLVSTGPRHGVPFQVPQETIALPDLDLPVAGPVAGICALAAWIENADDSPDLVVTAAVDTPFLPGDYVSRLVAELPPGAKAAMATCGANFYPTNAIWHRNTLMELAKMIHAGHLSESPRKLLASLDAARIEWPAGAEGDPFSNINTLADLIALTRRARALR